MAENNYRSVPVVKHKVKRRLHKGRACGCLIVLIILILIISSIISGCNEKNKDANDLSSAKDVMASSESTEEDNENKFIICIDPGHGGTDIGSNYGDREEKIDNLKYATIVFEELSKRDNIKVIMTRTDNDTYLDNQERAEFANSAGADLYIALHRNHSVDSTACGVEIWIQNEKDVVDEVLGYKLKEKLKEVGIQRDRGVHSGYTNDTQNNFQIIEYTNMPCCIVELGFISNDEDNKLFDANYEKYAVAIADAAEEICKENYLDKVIE